MHTASKLRRSLVAPVTFSLLIFVSGCSGSGGGSGRGGGTTQPTQPTTPVAGMSIGTPLIGYVGVTTNFPFTISSGGPIPVTLNGVSLSNTTSFTVTTNCPATLTAYATCTGTLAFTPAATGSYSTTVSLSDNAPNSPQTLPVTATANPAPAPNVTFSPTSLNFSNVAPNSASAVQVVQLTNSGHEPLNIASINITGANASAFVQTNSCSATLAAGSLCQIDVTMQPTAANANYSAFLTVTDNAGNVSGSTQSVALTGNSGASSPTPQLAISPSPLDFTGTTVGSSSLKSITLTNQGSGTLNLDSLAISGSSNFIPQTSASTCGATLGPGASCSYTVDFYAAAMGSYSGALTITDNALGSPQVVALTGSGVAAIASFVNGPVSFTNIAPNTSSSPFNLELQNTGNIPLSISSLTLAQNTPSVFSETSTCGSVLAPSAICTITLTFTPSDAASGYSSYLTLVSNSSPSTQTVTVTGTSTSYAAQTALHVEPDDGYQWLYSLVYDATTSIDITAAQLSDSSLVTDLINACGRGVRVRALLQTGGTGSSIDAAYTTLNSSGPNCSAAYTTIPSFQSSLVIDNRQIAVLTSALSSSGYASTRDYAWVSDDPHDIAAADATFSLDFTGTTPANYTPSLGSDLYWTPDTMGYLVSTIKAAQYSLFIESETISSPDVVNAIIQDCRNTNIAVELVVGTNDSDTPLEEINASCPNVIVANNVVHGTLVMVDDYSLRSGASAALLLPMPLSPALSTGRALGVFVSGNDNIQTLIKAIEADVAAGIPYE